MQPSTSSRPSSLSSLSSVLLSLTLCLALLGGAAGQTGTFSTFWSGSSPCGLTTDSQGFIYTSTCVTGTVQKWDAQGRAVASFDIGVVPLLQRLANTSGTLIQPDFMAVAPSGDLWSIEAPSANSNALRITSATNATSASFVDLTAFGGGVSLAFTPTSSNPWVVFPACAPSFGVQIPGCTQLMQIAANGSVLAKINTNAIPGLANGTVTAILSDASGALYVTAGSTRVYPSYGLTWIDGPQWQLIGQPGYYTGWNVYKISVTGQLLQTFVSPLAKAELYYSPALSPSGELYVQDSYNLVVYHFSPNGTVLQTLKVDEAGGVVPSGPLAVMAAGDLLGLSDDGISVVDLSSSGVPRFSFTTDPVPLSQPFIGALNPAGTVLYVGSYYTQQALATFSSNGTYLGSFARGVIQSVAGVDTDAAGNVYVADGVLGVILKFSPTGVLLRNFSALPDAPYPFNFGFNEGGAIAVNRKTGAIAFNDGTGFTVLAADCSLITRTGEGSLFESGAVAWSSSGLLVYSGNGTIVVQALNGTILTEFDLSYTQYPVPSGVVVTADDRVIISNIGQPDTNVLIYSLQGKLLNVLLVGELNPWGLAYSPATPSIVYEFDVSNNRLLSIPVPSAGPVSSARGDPQFVGLRGQSFQVHGIDGAVYALISEEHTVVNARFTFLSSGVCPVVDGVPLTNCWSHPGSYMGALSVQVRAEDGHLHVAVLTAGDAKTGFASVLVDGAEVEVGKAVSSGASFSVTRTGSHSLRLVLPSFELWLESSDRFVNVQQLSARVPLSRLTAHGLLGQTHRSALHASSLRYIEGEVDDYALPGDDLLSTDFAYSRFQRN